MWIVTALGHYIDWKYWSGSGRDLSIEELLFQAVLWPLGGALFGWMTWNKKRGNAESCFSCQSTRSGDFIQNGEHVLLLLCEQAIWK
jgi:hypothetical protein